MEKKDLKSLEIWKILYILICDYPIENTTNERQLRKWTFLIKFKKKLQQYKKVK